MRRQAQLLARSVASLQQAAASTSAASAVIAIPEARVQLLKHLHTNSTSASSALSTSGRGFAFSQPQQQQQRHATDRLQGLRTAGSVRTMFIQTQPTPNPQSLMFVPGKPIMESGSYEFPNARAGMVSPLAKKLFAVDGVTAVFFGSDFLTVTKKDEFSWPVLKPDLFAAIMDYYGSGEPLFLDSQTLAASDTAIHEDDDEVVAMIKELLETRIRPSVQEDGGDIAFRSFDPESGVVTVKMQGACSGCPSSAVTLKSGIQNMLMHYIPEVKAVEEAPPDEGEREAISEFEKFEAKLEGSAKAAAA